MLLSSFLKCSINFSKRCFSPQTWNTHYHCACEIPNISTPKLDAEILALIIISRTSILSPSHTLFTSLLLVNAQAVTWASTKAHPLFFLHVLLKSIPNVLFFHWSLFCHIFLAGIHNPRMLVMVFLKNDHTFPFYKSTFETDMLTDFS